MVPETRSPELASTESTHNEPDSAPETSGEDHATPPYGSAQTTAPKPTFWIILAAVVCAAAMTIFFFWQSATNSSEPPAGFPSQAELPLVAGEELPVTQTSIRGTQHSAAFSVDSEAAQQHAVDVLRESGYREIGRIDGGPKNTVVSMVNDEYAVRVEFSMPAEDEYRVYYVMAPRTETSGNAAD